MHCSYSCLPCGKASGQYKKIPVVVITDLYHPYQDPRDNMDLIMGFGLPDPVTNFLNIPS